MDQFGDFDDDEDQQHQQQHHAAAFPPGFAAGIPGGLLAQLAGMGGGMGAIPMPPWATGNNFAGAVRPPPRMFDEYYRAYSVAMLNQKERTNLSYGGKIIMPPSALANLTRLDIESPWMFQLRNPSNPAATTHAGVLEFIAEEGVVHLPYWMMKTLRLNEGDSIRITGAKLPQGKLVKIQPQTVDFLEISDPKAVLEQALRNFTCLTQGDVIEISYNCLTFEILIMEALPEGAGIAVVDTDLEVDFAPPKGYVEPTRPEPKPQETMASKLKIDTSSAEKAAAAESDFEAFKGVGQALNGRKTKGKGKAGRKIQEVDEFSKIIRTDKPRMVTADTVDADRKVPAALNLPFGKLFFGYPIVPLPSKPAADPNVALPSAASGELPTFTGTGQTLNGRAPRSRTGGSAGVQGQGAAVGNLSGEQEDKWKGKGRTLANKRDDVIELD